MRTQWSRLLFRFLLMAVVACALAYTVNDQLPEPSVASPSPSPTLLGSVPGGAQERGVVTKVVDGDTLKVSLGGEEKTVRLIGINTPETVAPQRPVECYGREASDYAKTLLTGKEVAMAGDETQQDMDRYGRLLRYVYLSDGLFVNSKMIREGYAVEYTYDRPYLFRSEFMQAQEEARQAGLGLWTACSATPDPDAQSAGN